MKQHCSPFVGDLTWDVIRDRLAAGAPAILPIGAGSKQHGLHLPLAADTIQGEWFAMQAAGASNALIWPVVNYGWYPAFTLYAGSISLQCETFEAVVADILTALLSQTRGCVLIINTGISTIDPVERVIARATDVSRVQHVPIYEGAHFKAARARVEQQPHGGHADEIETSIMLAIAPEMVEMARATASPPLTGVVHPGRLSPDNASSPNYSPSGSFGDPALATRIKGLELVAAILQDIDEACTRAQRAKM